MVNQPEWENLGPDDTIAEGDTFVLHDFLPKELAEVAFDRLKSEVQWNTMMHRGGQVPRLVAVEGKFLEDGSFPIYRHPSDESPPLLAFSHTVERIRQHIEVVTHVSVNHALIQLYRTGADYISEHSDKTIDVVRGSKIVNVSLGAQRVMTLRTKNDAKADPLCSPTSLSPASKGEGKKEKRDAQRVPLPHNSIFVMGLETNEKWMHSIRTDKRPLTVKNEAERFQNGERISLTFRSIGTFLTRDGGLIFGQGARAKTREEARAVVRGEPEAARLIEAFGAENQQSNFDWEAHYGKGFDVLHFTTHNVKCDNSVLQHTVDCRTEHVKSDL